MFGMKKLRGIYFRTAPQYSKLHEFSSDKVLLHFCTLLDSIDICSIVYKIVLYIDHPMHLDLVSARLWDCRRNFVGWLSRERLSNLNEVLTVGNWTNLQCRSQWLCYIRMTSPQLFHNLFFCWFRAFSAITPRLFLMFIIARNIHNF